MKLPFCALLGGWLLGALPSEAQNLVKNPSFEEGFACDGQHESTESVAGWSAVAGKPNFINPSCPLSAESKAYLQGMKLPPAAEGKAYAGLGLDAEGEFMEGQLSQPLQAGKRYWVKMRVRLPIRFCNQPIQEVGIAFSEKSLEKTKEFRRIDLPALGLQTNTKTPVKEQYRWEEISAFYEAKGGELVLTIGNFASLNEQLLKNRAKGQCTYIYIDAVSVEEYRPQTLPAYDPSKPLTPGERLVLGVDFEENTAVLKPDADELLQALAKTLAKNPALRIELSGHTDNLREESVNRAYANQRAKAVADFLVAKGIDPARIRYSGKGSAFNLVPNDSPENIRKNQRIELEVLKE